MHKKFTRLSGLLFYLMSTVTFAAAGQTGMDSEAYPQPENTGPVEMADILRSNGMIYVVVGVVLIVLIGLILYLVSVDRKVARLEREVNRHNTPEKH